MQLRPSPLPRSSIRGGEARRIVTWYGAEGNAPLAFFVASANASSFKCWSASFATNIIGAAVLGPTVTSTVSVSGSSVCCETVSGHGVRLMIVQRGTISTSIVPVSAWTCV